MTPFWKTFQLELRGLLRDPTLVAVLAVFILTAGYALYSGHAWHNELVTSAEHIESRDRALLRKHHAILLQREREHDDQARGFYDPSHPGAVGIFGGINAVLPPSPWTYLSVGQTDLAPQATLITTQGTSSLADGVDTQSPLLLLSGRFDLVYVLVVLLPLLLLALTHDLISRERELGRLTWLLAQPVSAARLLGARGLARALPLLAAALLISAVGIVWAQANHSTPNLEPSSGPRLLWWCLLVVAYSVLWLALGILVSLRSPHAAASGLGALACWLVLVVAIPAGYDTVVEWSVPLPSRTEHIAAKRKAQRQAEARADSLLSGYLRDHPELEGSGSNDDMMSFMPRYLAITEAVEQEVAPLQRAFDSAWENRQRLAQQLRFISPALVLQSALCDLAGTGPKRQAQFQQAKRTFQAEWRAFFLPKAFNKQRLTAADYEALPTFTMPAEQALAAVQRTVPDLLALGAFTALCALLAGLSFRGLSPIAGNGAWALVLLLAAWSAPAPVAGQPTTAPEPIAPVDGREPIPPVDGRAPPSAQAPLEATGVAPDTTPSPDPAQPFEPETPPPSSDEPGIIEVGTAPAQPISTSPPPPASLSASPAEPVLEVVVRGRRVSRAERHRRSAEAVQVIDTREAKRRSADLGEVIARTSGVSVRRTGGLGSEARLSLNGLTDDQIRFFLDGVPLHLSGFPFGLANVPVNLVSRLEVYRGVVPARFGADALGGAVNLVSDEGTHGTHGSASYQLGAFDTHRLSVEARDQRPESGFFSRVQGFYDTTRNNYLVDVEAEDADLHPQPVTVPRFHDGYKAGGGAAEVGWVHRPWAERLLLRVFGAHYHKELQNSLSMSQPYGAITYGETTAGASLRYEGTITDTLRLQAVGGYTYSRPTFRDVSACIYDWYGRCIYEKQPPAAPGESDREPKDQLLREDNLFLRAQLHWQPVENHALRVTVAPTGFSRTGSERAQVNANSRDPLSAERRLLSAVSAVEHEMSLVGQRLENIIALKNYLQWGRTEDTSPGANFRRLKRNALEWGVSDALRYRFHEQAYAKASYELATRLPSADEIFGDNIFIGSNLELQAERSHNLNLSLALADSETPLGVLRGELSGFLRETDQLIQLLGADRNFAYQNVARARSLGLECSAGWSSLNEVFALDGNLTYQSFRNTTSGSLFEGDRIPNRPYLFANGHGQVTLHEAFVPWDELSLHWYARYVHAFYRGWESAGTAASKEQIPTQLSHTLGLSYLVRVADNRQRLLALSLEVQNLTDADLYDYYGVQRPSRAAFARVTMEL